MQNRSCAIAFAAGILPRRAAALGIRGRRTGRVISVPVVVAGLEGERYLVAMLGQNANWVRNLRAAGGRAVLAHGQRETVRLEEVDSSIRAPILRRYLQVAPGARAHFPVNRRAPLEEFAQIAPDYPRVSRPGRCSMTTHAATPRAGPDGQQEKGVPRQPRRWRRRVIGGVAILVVLAVGGSVAGFHFIAAKAPASLTLPRSATRPGTPSTSSGPGQATLDGAWNTGPGSIAGWRVQEVFLWQQVTLTGHTSKISGSLTMSGTSVSHASFTVNMASVTTDQSQRNVLDTNSYPMATFVLTSPIELSGTPADGAVKQALATGNLSMHGITKAVRIAVSAERTGGSIYVLTDIPIAFADWHISLPDTGGLYGIKSPGTLEVLLHLTRSAGLTRPPPQNAAAR